MPKVVSNSLPSHTEVLGKVEDLTRKPLDPREEGVTGPSTHSKFGKTTNIH